MDVKDNDVIFGTYKRIIIKLIKEEYDQIKKDKLTPKVDLYILQDVLLALSYADNIKGIQDLIVKRATKHHTIELLEQV